MTKTFKVVTYVLAPEIDSKMGGKLTGNRVRTRLVIEKDLTWERAKAVRKENKGSEISPMNWMFDY